jgi:ribonuclease H / adenosylcobalamin/alpha-ribazole phosphatase
LSVEHVIVEADGGSRGNPGPAGYGAVVLDGATGAVLRERSEALGHASNNVAEYRGLIAGLAAARDLGARRVSVRLDSKLVVEQMSGRWRVKHPDMRALVRDAADLVQDFDEVTFQWVPREENTRADRLANEAMDRAAGRPVRAPAADEPSAGAATTTTTGAGTAGAATTTTTAAPMPQWAPPSGARTRLILVRHGSTEHSAAMRFSGRNDLPLDEAGRRQAKALAARPFGPVAAIVSSPLRRTLETAQVIADALRLDVEPVDDLAETDFGAWEGLTFAEARDRDGAQLDAWLAGPEAAPPGGESFAAVSRRVRRGRDAVLAARPGEVVVVVTHVTPIKQLVLLALGAPPSAMFRLHLDTASVSIVDYFPDGNCSVRLVNDTSHLR